MEFLASRRSGGIIQVVTPGRYLDTSTGYAHVGNEHVEQLARIGTWDSARASRPFRYRIAAVVVAAAMYLLPSVSRAEQRCVIVTFDASGSLATRYISATAHHKAVRIVETCLLDGLPDAAVNGETPDAFAPQSGILSSPVWRPGDLWTCLHMGDTLRIVEPLSLAPLKKGMLEAFYPRKFADSYTNLKAALRNVGAIAYQCKLPQIVWVSVSDGIGEYPEEGRGGPETDMGRAAFDEDFSLATLASIRLPGGGEYRRKPSVLLVTVRQISRRNARPSPRWQEPDFTESRRRTEVGELRSLVEAFPRSPDAAKALAKGLVERSDRSREYDYEALHILRDVIAADPDDPVANELVAQIYLRLGDLDASVQHCDAALHRDPERPLTLLVLAQARFQQRRDGDARTLLDHIIASERAPALLAEARYLEACLHSRAGEPSLAIASCTKAIELRPDMVKARLHRALNLALLKDYGAARADLEIVIQACPGSQNARLACQLLSRWDFTVPPRR